MRGRTRVHVQAGQRAAAAFDHVLEYRDLDRGREFIFSCAARPGAGPAPSSRPDLENARFGLI